MTSAESWYRRSMVRAGERPRLEGEEQEKELFPAHQIPHLHHPALADRLPEQRRRLIAHHLYQYLLFTVHLEVKVVNRAVLHLVWGLSGVDIASSTRLEALSIYCDEGYHALTCLDVVQQIAAATGIAPPPYDFGPTLGRLDRTVQKLFPHEPVLAELLQVFVFETVVTSILSEVPNDPAICKVVRQVVHDHARDEGRHHVFFSTFFAELWAVLSPDERGRVARCLPELAHACLRWDLAPIRWSLESTGLRKDIVADVLADCYGDHAAIPAVRSAARHMVQLCTSPGVLEMPGGREAFIAHGLM
jgi:hypothetical protein